MSTIIEKIKEIAHRVSEDYLLFGKGTNQSLISTMQAGEIENSEILKRICEQVNQNIYLALFNSPETDKANIKFEIADYQKILDASKEGEQAMKDYNLPPEDFRSGLEMAMAPALEQTKTASVKIASMYEMVHYKNTLQHLLSRVETMKTAEVLSAEDAFNKMASDAKVLVARGESLGDIAKIATRFVKEDLGGDFMKVASCYDMIHNSLKDDFHVNTSFTKLSSQKVNTRSEFIAPVRQFAESLAKVAGFSEMEAGLRVRITSCEKIMNENKVS